jgi:hypothetical protein
VRGKKVQPRESEGNGKILTKENERKWEKTKRWEGEKAKGWRESNVRKNETGEVESAGKERKWGGESGGRVAAAIF